MFGQFTSPVSGGGASLTVTGPVTIAGGELTLDITGLSSPKRITLILNGVDHTGGGSANDQLMTRIGSGGSVATTGYKSLGCWAGVQGNGAFYTDTTFFRIPNQFAGNLIYGIIVYQHMGSNLWTINFNGALNNTVIFYTGGAIQLAGTLTNVQLSTVGGTQTFIAGGQYSYIVE